MGYLIKTVFENVQLFDTRIYVIAGSSYSSGAVAGRCKVVDVTVAVAFLSLTVSRTTNKTASFRVARFGGGGGRRWGGFHAAHGRARAQAVEEPLALAHAGVRHTLAIPS